MINYCGRQDDETLYSENKLPSRHGECVINDKPVIEEDPGNWSEWAFSTCQSGCLPNVSIICIIHVSKVNFKVKYLKIHRRGGGGRAFNFYRIKK